MSFTDLNLASTYESGLHDVDVIKDFYIPVLENSYKYDRVAGYFSSKVFASSARGIAGLVRNNGKMRLITSHAFSPKDVETFQDHFDLEKFSNELINDFVSSFDKLGSLSGSIAQNHVGAMCWMLREGYLEIRVVIPDSADLASLSPRDIDLFHPKFGILYDGDGNRLAFSGSVNETESAWKRNIENLDVYQSWIPGRDDYINPKISQFEKYWNNGLTGKWKTIDLPSAVKNKIVAEYAPIDFPDIETSEENSEIRPLRSYQKEAIDSWISNDCKGILEMATGTGKTRTAKGCIEHASSLGKLLNVVVVPYQHIGEQWMKELKEFSPLMATGDWKNRISDAALDVTLGRRQNLAIVVVKNTASRKDFKDFIEGIRDEFENFLLIGDEVHWLGATTYQPAMLECANFRLGLSATPNRYFDDMGTGQIFRYFEKTIFELTLRQALELRDEKGGPILCPYEYHPILVTLNQEEFNLYREFTSKIMKLKGIESSPEIEAQIQNLYIQRAAVAKSAKSKIPALEVLLANLPRPITQTLIYCADFKQLEDAAKVLNSFGIQAQQITGQESASASHKFNYVSEREHIINNFAAGNLDVLLAIECLDEGVDIPSAEVGIILASSGNVKEFIQRRGRLMRPFRDKEKAKIYDLCVLPEDPNDPLSSLGLVDVEIRRIESFGADALNFEEVQAIVETVQGRI